MQYWKQETQWLCGYRMVVSVLYPPDQIDDWTLWRCHRPESQESVQTTQHKPWTRSKVSIWSMASAYWLSLYTIIKSKNSKSNHPNLGIIYVCVLVCVCVCVCPCVPVCVCVCVWSHGTEINFVLSIIVFSPLLPYKTNLNFYLFSLYKYSIYYILYLFK